MKKWIGWILIFALCFALTACKQQTPDTLGTEGNNAEDSDIIEVVVVSSADGSKTYTTYFEDGLYQYTLLAFVYSSEDEAQDAADRDFSGDESVAVTGNTLTAIQNIPELAGKNIEEVVAYWDNQVATNSAFQGMTVSRKTL